MSERDHMRKIFGHHPPTSYLRSDLEALPGYPFLPCPICRGSEGCDHSVPERARAAHPGLPATTIR